MSYVRATPLRLTVVGLVATLALAACGSSAKTAAPPTTVVVPTGGTLTVGAEIEPACLDWLSSCASLEWGAWMAQIETLPMVFRTQPTGAPNSGDLAIVPGPVLAGEPKLETSPVQKITYTINPAAVWSDGVAITCADFQYVVDQQKTGSDLLDTTGYDDIDKVTCPTPKTAVVTYKAGTTYANWKTLFAGSYGLLPSHILKGKDRDALMKDGYSWSGGPWIAKFNRGQNITLTPNPKYWGPKPKLDKVVFKFLTKTATEFEAMKSGQVDAIYPQPQPDVVDQIVAGGLTDDNTVYNPNTASVEALWMNNAKAPFDSKAVRTAFAYAIDRDALVNKLFGKLGVKSAWNSFNPYVVRQYGDPEAFSKYHADPAMVTQLMSGDGWTKGKDGIWAKNGQKASLTIITTSDNERRSLTEQALQEQLHAAGFDVQVKGLAGPDLGKAVSTGDFQLAVLGSTLTALTPSLCSVFCSSNIPTNANQYSGNNIARVSISAVDPLLATVDNSANESARMTAGKQADDLLADNVASLPLDPLPDILIWSKKVVGPIQDNSIEGMFWNLDQWGITK